MSPEVEGLAEVAEHYYGERPGFMPHLLKHLRPGGRLCIGSPCFNREFTPTELDTPPAEYSGPEFWGPEFSRYHSPGWWQALLEETGLVRTVECTELGDGVVMWEDELAHNIEREAWSLADAERDLSQIAYGYQREPYLTHFVLVAEKIAG